MILRWVILVNSFYFCQLLEDDWGTLSLAPLDSLNSENIEDHKASQSSPEKRNPPEKQDPVQSKGNPQDVNSPPNLLKPGELPMQEKDSHHEQRNEQLHGSDRASTEKEMNTNSSPDNTNHDAVEFQPDIHVPPCSSQTDKADQQAEDNDVSTVDEEKEVFRERTILGNNASTLNEHTANRRGGKIKRRISSNVLILGAGMAGISAAKTLRELGVQDIVVVEGADRIGGRVKDVEFGGINVEVGANWLHFSSMSEIDVNPLEKMINEANLNSVEDDYEDYIFRYQGKNVTSKANEAFDHLEKALSGAVKLAKKKIEKGEPDVNFRVALALQDWRPLTPIERAAEFFDFDFEFGDDPSSTGLKSNYEVFDLHGKNDQFIADKRGYAHIIYKMSETIPLKKDENLFLDEYVTKISYQKKGNKKVEVKTTNSKDGSINLFSADFVICTFSIGVLESDLVEFKPKLPAWKEEIIYMYKMIRYIKIFVKFPDHIKAFWDDNHYILYVDPHTRGKYQVWQNLEAGGRYFPRGTNVLLVTVVGNNWERVQYLTKQEIIAELYQVLRNMYGDDAVMPEDILIPDWHHNPLFLGAYSNWPIGVNKKTYQNMDAPVGRLYFAGEACSEDFTGYLHGALESGQLTAQNVYKCMEKNDCEAVPPDGYGYKTC